MSELVLRMAQHRYAVYRSVLRALVCSSFILNGSHLGFLELAGSSLPSISLRAPLENPLCWTIPVLTRLELAEWHQGRQESIEALQRLPLQELILVDCDGLELKLFAPGKLSKLRKLHIEAPSYVYYANEDDWFAPDIRDALEKAGEAVLQLPELHQLSGRGDLFRIGLEQGLRDWVVAALAEDSALIHLDFHSSLWGGLKIWTKA